MAAQHTRSFGREAAAVYLAAALVVFGTWAASRYLILRKFENIEQNEVSRNIEVMRKALVTKNTEIETVSVTSRAGTTCTRTCPRSTEISNTRISPRPASTR